jgi:hypothetical protein
MSIDRRTDPPVPRGELSRVRALQTAYAFDLDSGRAAEFAAAAVVVYEKAVRAGKGLLLDFAG